MHCLIHWFTQTQCLWHTPQSRTAVLAWEYWLSVFLDQHNPTTQQLHVSCNDMRDVSLDRSIVCMYPLRLAIYIHSTSQRVPGLLRTLWTMFMCCFEFKLRCQSTVCMTIRSWYLPSGHTAACISLAFHRRAIRSGARTLDHVYVMLSVQASLSAVLADHIDKGICSMCRGDAHQTRIKSNTKCSDLCVLITFNGRIAGKILHWIINTRMI